MIRSIDKSSVHRITSGQVLVDLQTAIKELVENSLDAGATNIEVRLKDHGLTSIEVVDNGSGIAPEDYEHVARKHYTSKLSSFEDLSTITSFGFRGEALSSLCALSERVTITTATSKEEPLGTILELDKSGALVDRSKTVARKTGTTVLVEGLFKPLPVRRKELERNTKRELAKALNLLNAYALVPCAKENKGVRLTVSLQAGGGKRTVQLRTDGHPSTKSSISALWGPRQVESLAELDLKLEVVPEKAVLRRQGLSESDGAMHILVRGYISKFSSGHGRSASDRQYFYINGRPCNPSKIQKAFNEVYKTFNANQSPFVVADFVLPTDACDINVSPDKRTILLHSENSLVTALKESLEETFSPSRSTFSVQTQLNQTQSRTTSLKSPAAGNIINPPVPSDASNQTIEDISNSVTMGEPHLLLQAEASLIAASGTDPTMDESGRDERSSRSNDEDKGNEARSSRGETTPRAVHDAGLDASNDDTQMPLFLEGEEQAKERDTIISTASIESGNDVDSTPMDVDASGVCHSSTPASYTTATSQSGNLFPRIRPRSPSPPTMLVSHPPSNPPSRSVQLILDTSNAAWNVRRPQAKDILTMGMVMNVGSGASGRPYKRLKADGDEEGGASASGKSTRLSLREQLAGFAKKVAVVQHGKEESSAEEDDEGEAKVELGGEDGEEVDELEYDGDDAADEGGAERSRTRTQDVKDEGVPVAVPIASPDRVSRSAGHETTSTAHTSPEGLTPNNAIALDDDSDVDDTGPQQDPFRSPLVDGTSDAILSHADADDLPVPPQPLEVMRTVDGVGSACASFDITAVTEKWNSLSLYGNSEADPSSSGAASTSTASPNIFKPDDDEIATRQLSRVIHKEDFERMDVVGQFNRGFIIARNRGHTGAAANAEDNCGVEASAELNALDDLYIIDQHAADEKYNFEKLQAETKLESQRLFAPRPLELSAAEELVALDNVDILQLNGFEVAVDEDLEPGRGRIKLVAQPVSKNTLFDIKDLEELLHLLQDQPPTTSNKARTKVRCSRVRTMFAMRACRMSIMIGKPLTKNQMTTVVRHMGTMDQPWNCPHGRPTMRHLVNLKGVSVSDASNRGVDWEKLRT